MIENLLAEWKAISRSDTTFIVVPDGCRDLIMKSTVGERPRWFVSSLYDQAEKVSMKADSMMVGFRMKPGVCIDKKGLLASISDSGVDNDELFCRLSDFTHRKNSVEEALGCLAFDVESVAHAAKHIGVHQRTLQRLLIKETERPPIYWMMLARMRRAARAILEPIPLIEIADMSGYADQSHMNREFKRWLGISPSALRNAPDIVRNLSDAGYD